jgi:primosomal protein N' (replication factor Y)
MLVDVALPLPLFRTFVYEVDDAHASRAKVGARIVVPFRNRRQLGIIVAADVPAPAEGIKVKRAVELPDPDAVVSEGILTLCRWVAEYYAVPLGVALRTALPVALTGADVPRPSQRTQRVVVIQQTLPSLIERDATFARTKQQRAVFELVESLGGRAPVPLLLERMKFSPAVLKALEKRGLIAIEEDVVARDPFARRPVVPPVPFAPTADQRNAIDRLTRAAPGEVFLLHGVTGSGKTLVYVELLREVVDRRGQSAIVLVPEIALTPQTVDRFRAVFGDRVAVLHSALSDGERLDAWLALQRGEKRIAVGARSAIFAPLTDLGAIVVDEEHEATYKQGETPRYHAREVALVRARAGGAVVVLGSATPSLESWRNAQTGKYGLLALPTRVGEARLPVIEVVDRRDSGRGTQDSGQTRREPATRLDAFSYVIGPEMETALRETRARGEQSIVLLNRRGYAAFVQCAGCGFVHVCPNCSISLTYHRSPERLVCHYCLHAEEPRAACERCGGAMLKQRGLGTQQVERLLGERFPEARITRMDVDTTSAKWAHSEILDRVGRGEVDILLGTQMIAKGLDFPNVTLVGVVDADVGINLPDFRASERCFQLLSQVAGRAGRGPKGGRVLIQTRMPGHHAVQCALAHDYLRFVERELRDRQGPVYPPFVRLAHIVVSATSDAVAQRVADAAGQWLHGLIDSRSLKGLTLLGPAKAPVERIKQRWRWRLVLKSEGAANLTRVGQFFVRKFPVPNDAEARVTWDRDPVSLM